MSASLTTVARTSRRFGDDDFVGMIILLFVLSVHLPPTNKGAPSAGAYFLENTLRDRTDPDQTESTEHEIDSHQCSNRPDAGERPLIGDHHAQEDGNNPVKKHPLPSRQRLVMV